ncbi:type II toxin-antitoxin system VapC family toxin [Desulfovibrio sp. ZJ369]|uniref:type II toxin-antitoxin system VapC family toxin n=1 Tax=Desulfovibrio sp. ZJ369 TaxID=2709793 RepID=UPI0013EA3625|nr:type II toxin-antitoxin system VapC family toxin [Desulfovibrio sp. ZJ369]
MKNKAYDLSSYVFRSGEKILLDTNIWLYLFPAPAGYPKKFVSHYSTAFARLIKAKAQPVLSPIVLSEYLNRYIRIEWQGCYQTKYRDFKNFRKSTDFTQVAASMKVFAQKILQSCQVHDLAANALNLQQSLNEFVMGNIDFNDAVLVDICKQLNFKLMTNDSDFQYGGIEILTTNPTLLNACP